MANRRANTQMFALSSPPPDQVQVGSGRYRLVRVFKHDFFAATCLYEPIAETGQAQATGGGGAGPQPRPLSPIVVKFGRVQAFCGLPMAWYGRMMRRHEEGIYRTIAGVPGVPPWIACIDDATYAIGYIDALPLDHFDSPPPGLFDRLKLIIDAIHARGVAYCDANKRSNILIDPAGNAYLVDYQIAFRRRDELPWPLRSLVAAAVRYVQRSDMYHLYKHKRRLAPDELRPEERELSRRRGLLHTIHRKLTDPWRALRRKFLRKQHASGQLVSPTAAMEDHHQPEKATWRG